MAALAGIASTAFADRRLARNANLPGGLGPRGLADIVRPLGTGEVLASAVALGYLAGRVFDRPALAGSSVRIAVSIGAAAAVTEAVKLAVGRARPHQAPDDPDQFDSFSGHNSFPSGHTTVAFAAAAALDRETTARWVPWAAYPLASLVGWSRVRDNQHWGSDVVAGAAVGFWTARKAEDFMRARKIGERRVSACFAPEPGGASIVGRYTF